jgi:hypothetical protein
MHVFLKVLARFPINNTRSNISLITEKQFDLSVYAYVVEKNIKPNRKE